MDETRVRRVRWLLEVAGWRRSGASVRGWLGLQSEEFRAGVQVVAIDPSAPFAAVLRDRKLLPNATLVVDHWHLHRLANLITCGREHGHT